MSKVSTEAAVPTPNPDTPPAAANAATPPIPAPAGPAPATYGPAAPTPAISTTSAPAPKRFVSIRLTEAEFNDLQSRVRNTTCRSLTDFVRKRLFGKPLTTKVRNESQDQLLHEIIQVKNKINTLLDIAANYGNSDAFHQLIEIKTTLLQIARQWLQ